MALCQGTKLDGSPCTVAVLGKNVYCWHHDPAHAAKRQKIARKAGSRTRPTRQLQDVKDRLFSLAERAEAGEMDYKVAAVCGQLLNYLVRAISVEVQVKESQEFEERLAEVEAAIEAQKQQRHSPGSTRFTS